MTHVNCHGLGCTAPSTMRQCATTRETEALSTARCRPSYAHLLRSITCSRHECAIPRRLNANVTPMAAVQRFLRPSSVAAHLLQVVLVVAGSAVPTQSRSHRHLHHPHYACRSQPSWHTLPDGRPTSHLGAMCVVSPRPPQYHVLLCKLNVVHFFG